MLQNTSRPPSVLITQVILICLGGLWLVGGPLFLLASIKNPAVSMVYLVFGVLMIVFSLSFLVGFWGLAKRKGYGRWIGVIGLSLLLLSIFLGNAFPSSEPHPFSEYKTIAESTGAMAASIVFYGLIIFLIYRLARGKRANEFFGGEAAAAPR
jgi:hypothetical protein